jgi:hypothetical protein
MVSSQRYFGGMYVEERLPDAALADALRLAQLVRRERGRGFDEFFVGPAAVLIETLEDETAVGMGIGRGDYRRWTLRRTKRGDRHLRFARIASYYSRNFWLIANCYEWILMD